MAPQATSTNKTYVKEALRLMMLGEGWKVTLEHIVTHIAFLDDHYIFRAGTAPNADLHRAMGERAGLVHLVRVLYQLAETPCPFDTQRQALLSSIHLDVPQPVPTPETQSDICVPENAPPPRPRRYPGSIA